VLAPPPAANGELATSADVRALLSATRGYGSRVALIVCDPGRAGMAERAEALARTLSARGWRAAPAFTDQPLAAAWLALARTRQRGRVEPSGTGAAR
jgi:hypothetical protein